MKTINYLIAFITVSCLTLSYGVESSPEMRPNTDILRDVYVSELIEVKEGELPAESKVSEKLVKSFEISKHEVTWGEWKAVMQWAVKNGYRLSNVGQGLGDKYPVTHISWYDAVEWCNSKSEMEGLLPVYEVQGKVYKRLDFGNSGSFVVNQNVNANGYRLPTEAEWEWAARGGVKSKGFIYSGSNEINDVCWHKGNSNDTAHEVGTKLANELGIYDMSGNVTEWCWDLKGNRLRSYRSGGYFDSTHKWFSNQFNELSFHDTPDIKTPGLGFRLARNIQQ